MIKIENVEVMGWEHTIRGIRNTMGSWNKSDSGICKGGEDEMGVKNDYRKNAEGYSDPTACEALRNIEREEERFHKLLDTIFTLCELSDFHVEERIVIKDKRTGRIWR